MITKFTLTGFNLLFSLIAHAQNKQYLYYFDQDFDPVSKAKSVFNGVGLFKDGILEFKLYNSRTSVLLLTEHYTDSTLNIQNGLFQNFYGNSALASEGGYIREFRREYGSDGILPAHNRLHDLQQWQKDEI